VVQQGKIARNAGATWIMGGPNNPDGYEVKHTDHFFDIAAHGWAGSQKYPGSDDSVVHPNPQRRQAKFDERRARAQANANWGPPHAATRRFAHTRPAAAPPDSPPTRSSVEASSCPEPLICLHYHHGTSLSACLYGRHRHATDPAGSLKLLCHLK
jgi:hypothetical protein